MGSGIRTSVTLTLQENTKFSPFSAADFDKGLEWAQRVGFDGVELVVNHPETVGTDRLMERLREQRLTVSTLSTGQMLGEELMFCNEMQEVRRKAVDRICRHIDLSTALGFPNVTVGLARGTGSPNASREERLRQLRFVAESLQQCAEYAKKKKVLINLEAIDRYETSLLNSVEETALFLDEAGLLPTVGIFYDTFHSNIEDADMYAAIERYGSLFSHVHFADSNRWVPGSGHIDFQAAVSRLEKVGFAGFVSLECLNLPDAGFVRGHAGILNSLVRKGK